MTARVTRPPDRIRVRRNPKNGRYERATVEAILERLGGRWEGTLDEVGAMRRACRGDLTP
jgi:hypothetical protein